MTNAMTLPPTANQSTVLRPAKATRTALFPEFSWPAPLSALYQKAEPWDEPQACTLEGINGAIAQCSLISVSPVGKTIAVQIERTNAPITLSFAQFRRLTLKKPIYSQTAASNEHFPGLGQQQAVIEYHLHLLDGKVRSGLTAGYVETAFGLFLFTPLDDQGALERVFVPHDAFVSMSLSDQIGHPDGFEKPGISMPLETAALATDNMDCLADAVVTTPEQLMQALDHQSKMPMIRLGEALLRLGYVTEAQVHQALAHQNGISAQPLGELLIQMGVLTRGDLNNALARKMGYPVVDVTRFPIEPAALSKIPVSTARRLMVLPLLTRSSLMVIACVDPTRRVMIEELEFLLRTRVIATLADEQEIARMITTAYDKLGMSDWPINPTTDATPLSESLTSGNELLESMELQDQNTDAEKSDERPLAESDNTLVRLINTMIAEAYARGVSDIHVECLPQRAKVRIRFRNDGLLSPYLELPHTYRSALVARLKIMADLDISERRKPQDGKIDFHKFSPRHRLELRLATIPTSNGLEDVVMRLLSSAKPMALDTLAMSADNLEGLRQAISRPYGMVLCVGPTGSGKTTTLHSVLDFLNTPERKIWTCEDPIEITQPALRQVQVNSKIDWTFAKALRSFLRADPDIIMVGEIRDAETAQIAIEASLTGHLVLSTLHTNSAAETVTRLIDMGMDPFNFADSLLAVLAQRLARRLCSHCKTSEPASQAYLDELLEDYLRAFPQDQAPAKADVLAQWQTHYSQAGKLQHYHAPGCSQCRNSGMKGRIGLHELLTIAPSMRRLIQTNAHTDALVLEAFKGVHFAPCVRTAS